MISENVLIAPKTDILVISKNSSQFVIELRLVASAKSNTTIRAKNNIETKQTVFICILKMYLNKVGFISNLSSIVQITQESAYQKLVHN